MYPLFSSLSAGNTDKEKCEGLIKYHYWHLAPQLAFRPSETLFLAFSSIKFRCRGSGAASLGN